MSRVYEIDGKQYWSVTTILGILEKPALVPWAAKMTAEAYSAELLRIFQASTANTFADIIQHLPQLEDAAKKNYRKQSETAMSYGTTVHELIEEYCKTGVEPELSDHPIEVQTAWASWKTWLVAFDYEPLAQEIQVCNTEVGYAGRFDAIAMVNGICTLVDFKTSSGFYGDEYLYQLAAYWMAAPDEYDIKQGGILRLDKTTGMPEWKVYDLDDLTRGWEIFRLLAKVYPMIKGEPKPAKKGGKTNGVNN